MGGRVDTSPLGIPKSPSFHSGLDLVASASVDSLVGAQTSSYIETVSDKNSYTLEENKFMPCVVAKYASSDVIDRDNKKNIAVKTDISNLTLPLHKNASAVRTLQSTGFLPQLTGDLLYAELKLHVRSNVCLV